MLVATSTKTINSIFAIALEKVYLFIISKITSLQATTTLYSCALVIWIAITHVW